MKNKFYAMIEIEERNKNGNKIRKKYAYDHYGLRHEALKELQRVANKLKGKITYFGTYKNKLDRDWIRKYHE